jgi:hypothetical protein
MQKQSINSRLIKSVRYDEQAQLLEVELRSGKLRQFTGVRKTVYDNLLAAESPGWYYTYHIRKGEPEGGSSAGNLFSVLAHRLPIETLLKLFGRFRRRST